MFDVAIVGGGIVGLATACAMLEAAPRTRLVVLEKEARPGMHQTGHNSGVLHSGLYYKPGSSKAKTCVLGAQRMLAYCAARRLPCRVVGKVVVAVDERELPRLDELERRGTANGVAGLRRIGADALREIEPFARGVAALHVPGAAIVDYAAVALALADDVRALGGELRLSCAVRGARRETSGWRLVTERGDVAVHRLVTCGGLWSDRLAALAEGRRQDVRIVPFRGEYWRLREDKEHWVNGLIYPVPDPRFPFLGVHFTRMVGGGVECGPNAVLALRRDGYRRGDFSIRDALSTLCWPGFWRLAARHFATGAAESWRSHRRSAFATALRRLGPPVTAEDLVPADAGVRAQALQRNGALVDDFLVVDTPDSMHVLNAPSPAATASLAIGTELASRALRNRFLPI
ncbi:MAG: L-2-hydroxyglutarate oxidase [Planctomycetes bacterium]|nr:L-2-hydroxyglutarate oxidase [Planctomycetota bacterium]